MPFNLNIPSGSLVQTPLLDNQGDLILTVNGDDTTTFGAIDQLTVGLSRRRNLYSFSSRRIRRPATCRLLSWRSRMPMVT